MKRGLLIIDRGSHEDDVKHELQYICDKVKQKGNYHFSDYCFLEVVPPYIEEGINTCLSTEIDSLTIVPYFLYPGRKVKAAVDTAIKFQSKTKVKLAISKPMSLHKSLIKLVDEKIQTILEKNKVTAARNGTDILIIGHGSKDPDARSSLKYVADGLEPLYRNVNYCFLEIEEPNIQQGIDTCAKNNPEVLVVVPYFLHKGAHVKRDIYEDLNPAIASSGIKKIFLSDHLGTDDKMVDLVLERAKEVER
ncbi:Sirohydrochlorin cobaltochelatase CbiX(long) [Candidatus Nitrosotalea sp. TS]|uniref:sirohydrochlorin chelatase n=1 Tax=Candidatus Nitrosotalea sp. TS TaxID=2341020 RepID=UPI00140AD860|nr:CbiX/SirB N-terminal domain-containing protein [Candidatus Nitrosotalea sp. TS]NHI04083.1 Sirohydrochlorin cobaltochelatase CbiX(long) [Candidatus Nitrosotalea sp. TS]